MTRHVTGRGVNWEVVAPVITGNPDWNIWDAWDSEVVEPHTLDIIAKYVEFGTTVIDVGAYLGSMSLWAAHCGAHVLAVEPDPVAADFLKQNVALNHANIEVFEGALSSVTGTTHIQSDIQGWASSMTRVNDIGTEVPCLTFPDLFDVYDIDHCALVKMDIEGFESIVLEHAAPFLAELGIPLYVSMHQPWWSRPVDPTWFSGYSHIEGDISGWNDVLCVP